jgi:hypothetical protein
MWHAWRGGEIYTGFQWESPNEKDHLKDKGIDGRVGSKWTLGRLVGGYGVDLMWLRIGILAGSSECDE